MREFMRTRMAARTHDSGMEELAMGSERGRTVGGSDEVGRTPACWCWRRALPRTRECSVRVFALPPKPMSYKWVKEEDMKYSKDDRTCANTVDAAACG